MSEVTVLVVDDEANLRATISFMLEMEGFAVATAENGEQAVAMVRNLRPSVVLLDAMMPLKDGFEVCREIRADAGLANTAVVMVTALGQRADQQRALAAGADHFVTKPFEEEKLLELVRRLVARGGDEPE